MTDKKWIKSDYALLGGAFYIASLPLVLIQNSFTQGYFEGVSFLFFLGFVYRLFGGKKLFYLLRQKMGRGGEYVGALGWMPYAFVIMLLGLMLLSFCFPTVFQEKNSLLLRLDSIFSWLWLCAGVGSLGWMWYKKRFKK